MLAPQTQVIPLLLAFGLGVVAGLRHSAQAAEGLTGGEGIYRKLCSECHGIQGEGVKGKYDDSLHGDWSLDKLTRYIEKSMPEDAPEKCVGEDAAVVARHVHDSFYSREARERRTPPRVELVRLTNRQYVNTVADLLSRWSYGSGSQPGQPGLQAIYYDKHDFQAANKAFERVDPSIHFDFLTMGHREAPLGTNQIAVQWRGALLAEESGDYEFFLRSPNGVRLWVNDTELPLVDAWVASGADTAEHRAGLKLIGGRRYPLKIDYFRFKDPKASISLEWRPPHGVRQSIPTRNLTTAGGASIYVVTTRFPPDDESVRYERGVSVSREWDDATTHAAIEVANYVVGRLDRFSRSKPGDTNRHSKVVSFCEQFVAAAFRRSLSPELKQTFVTSHFESDRSEEAAVKAVILLALKSPRFLYLGLTPVAERDDSEIAARLSYGLWDSMPDSALTRAADARQLHTREQAASHVGRMLRDPRAQAKMLGFLHHWLQMDRMEDFTKDASLYTGFTPEIVADLRTSLNLFLQDATLGPDSDYRRLLLADHLYMNGRLAGYYGVQTNLNDEFVKIGMDPKERSGIITHPYLLSAFAYQKVSSPIHRGVFLTRNIVGRSLKPPPSAVAFNDSDFPANLTMREKVEALTRPQACQNCHSVINPLGFSLEHYDAVGRFRTRDGDQLIDAISQYTTDEGQVVRLGGARDVAEFAIGSEQAQNGFVEQLFHAVVKQPIRAYGPETMNQLRRLFVATAFNIEKLLTEIAILAALHPGDPSSPPKPSHE